MIPPLDSRGMLPLGRHVTDLAEVHGRFAFNAQREEMFEELLSLLQVVTLNIHPVNALWIGGSYLSSKPDPNDIDVVFLIPARALLVARRSGDTTEATVELLVEGDPLDHFPSVGVRLLPDEGPFVGAVSDASLNQRKWMAHRGYWDQLWQCARGARVDDQIPNDHGYLEVTIDGYGS